MLNGVDNLDYVTALTIALARGPDQLSINEAICTEEMHLKWFQLNSIELK